MAFFWTPLADILRYDYPRDYRVFYPIFYWGFCPMVVAMDIFYKIIRSGSARTRKIWRTRCRKQSPDEESDAALGNGDQPVD